MSKKPVKKKKATDEGIMRMAMQRGFKSIILHGMAQVMEMYGADLDSAMEWAKRTQEAAGNDLLDEASGIQEMLDVAERSGVEA